MTQYNRVNVKLSTSQLNKRKSAIKNENDVVIRLSPNMIGDPNDKTNFPHELLLRSRHVSSIRKAFSNNSSVDIKFSKTQLSKMIQSGGFLGKLLGPLLKSVLIPLGLTAAASAANAGIHKKILGSGNNITLIISNKDMDDLIKILKSLEDSGLLLKEVTESVQNEVKKQKGGFVGMLLRKLGASLLGNLLTGKGVFHAGKRVNKKGKGIHRAGEGIVRAGEGSNSMDF